MIQSVSGENLQAVAVEHQLGRAGPRPPGADLAYSVSKAAAFSLTQSLRALLAGRGVRVHAVLTGPADTDMTARTLPSP